MLKKGLNGKEVLKIYLSGKPDIKKKYQLQMQRIKKIKTLAGLGVLTVAVGTGVAYKLADKESHKAPGITIEKSVSNVEDKDEELNTYVEYSDFFEKLDNITNTEKRNDQIVDFTKGKIVEAYNKNSETTIGKEQLEYYHLNEFVIVNKDNLGNAVSYKRTSQKVEENLDKNQEFERLHGGIYEFKVDGKTVAVYDANGNEIVDDNIENKEEFFKKSLAIIKQASKLQDVYKYKSTERDIDKEQVKSNDIADRLVENNIIIQSKVNELDNQLEK